MVRVPLEYLKSQFRIAHVAVERENNNVKPAIEDLSRSFKHGRTTSEQAVETLDAQIARLQAARAKLAAIADDEENAHKQLAQRTSHLDELYSIKTVDDGRYRQWAGTRLDRLLVDYMMRQECMHSAISLSQTRGIQRLVDVDLFMARNKIRNALLGRSLTEALQWVSDHKKELKKMEASTRQRYLRGKPLTHPPQSPLEFKLRLQHYIELLRQQTESKLYEAIAYAKKYIYAFRTSYEVDVLQACGALCGPGPVPCGPPGSEDYISYPELWTSERWNMLTELFTNAYDTIYGIPASPPLMVALWSGLSAIKTPACRPVRDVHARKTPSELPRSIPQRHTECPICSLELSHLASVVPYAQHAQSRVDPDPVLLPNGRVYGRHVLGDHAGKHSMDAAQRVKDPVTGEVYDASLLRKIYIL
jgi:macrophage erythroblast attacher